MFNYVASIIEKRDLSCSLIYDKAVFPYNPARYPELVFLAEGFSLAAYIYVFSYSFTLQQAVKSVKNSSDKNRYIHNETIKQH